VRPSLGSYFMSVVPLRHASLLCCMWKHGQVAYFMGNPTLLHMDFH